MHNNQSTSKKCKSKDISFKYLSAKAKINFSTDDNNTSFTANIRMKENEMIWISGSVMGFEGVRCKITPDSVFVKQSVPEKKYYLYSFDQLSKLYKTPLSFDIIQSILLGNKPIKKSENETSELAKDYCVIIQHEAIFSVKNQITLSNSKISKIDVAAKDSSGMLAINYADFREAGKHLFPFQSDVAIKYKDQSSVKLEINYKSANFTSSELKFPFKVSDKYVRQ